MVYKMASLALRLESALRGSSYVIEIGHNEMVKMADSAKMRHAMPTFHYREASSCRCFRERSCNRAH